MQMNFTSLHQRHAYEQAAWQLPDAMFTDAPRIVTLTQAIADLEKRAQIARAAALDPEPVKQAIEGIKQDLRDAAGAVNLAITRDLLNKDRRYPQGVEALAVVEGLERRLKAAQLAVGVFDSAAEISAKRAVRDAIQGELDRTVTRRREAVLECKFEHLRANRHHFKLP